jgi:hypothetical protein
MMANYPQVMDSDEANALESKAVDDLRELGHCVYPEGLGLIDFRAYQQ